jgi:hypothetical protein
MLKQNQVAPCSPRSLLAITLALGMVPFSCQALDVQGCRGSDYLDRTAPGADREIEWDYTIFADPERCMQVSVGQAVVFQGDFSFHPLDGFDGDTPNPISNHDVNGSVTFLTAGTFGYRCLAHGPMTGAIRVVAPATATVPLPAWGGIALAALLLATARRFVLRSRSAASGMAGSLRQ